MPLRRGVNVREAGPETSSKGVVAPLAGADPHGVEHVADKDLAVADLTRPGGMDHRLDRRVGDVVGDDGDDADFGHEVEGVGAAPEVLGLSLLSAEAAHLFYAHAGGARVFESGLDVLQLVHADDSVDLLHAERVYRRTGPQWRRMNVGKPPLWLALAPWVGVLVTVVSLSLLTVDGLRVSAIVALGTVGVAMPLAMTAAAHYASRTEAERDAARKHADTLAQEVQRHKDALDDLAEGLDVGILLVDPKLKIEYANQRAVSMFEFNRPEGQTLLTMTMSAPFVSLVEGVATTGEPAKDELTFDHPEERIMAVVAWCESTELKRIFVSLYDITHLRRLERVRRDFVANVSHELRTPLTTIRAMAETLVENPGDLAMKEKYETGIIFEIDRLTRITEDLLTLSTLEAGQSVKSDVDLAEIVRNVVEQAKPKAAKKGLSLRLDAPDTLPLQANDHQMTQVILNLVDNAINYTQEGGVEVTLRKDEGQAVIEVKDSGIGLAVDHHPRIFERFYRVDRGRSRETGGTGLGLSIVRNIAEAHGGKVAVASELGHGSTFTVYLPLV